METSGYGERYQLLKQDTLFYDVGKDIERFPSLNFYIFISVRGLGKTYSALDYVLDKIIKSKGKMIYLRLTEKEMLNTVTDPNMNPFETLNNDKGYDINVKTSGDMGLIMNGETENIGYCFGLSTFGKFRGMDLNDVEYIVFDEFLALSKYYHNAREDLDFGNMVETVNHSRELRGKKGVVVILLANSNKLSDSGIIRLFRAGATIYKLASNIEENNVFIDEERGLMINLIIPSEEFLKKKSETSLYRLTKGTRFYEFALENRFIFDYFGDVKKQNLVEFFPICSYEKLYFYKHKSKSLIYCCTTKGQCPSYNERTLNSFKRDFGYMLSSYYFRDKIYFSDYDTKIDFENIGGI